jgi:hypothetical protein
MFAKLNSNKDKAAVLRINLIIAFSLFMKIFISKEFVSFLFINANVCREKYQNRLKYAKKRDDREKPSQIVRTLLLIANFILPRRELLARLARQPA